MIDERNKRGQFVRGKSGNPAGRPKSELVRLRGQLAEHGHDLVAKAVELALSGDTAALKLCLDRISPPLRPRSAPVNVPLGDAVGLGDMARAFIEAASEGRISPDDAAQLLSGLAGASRVIEASEIEERISKLEETQNAKP